MSDRVDLFGRELKAVGGVLHRVASEDEAAATVRSILKERGVQSVVRTPNAVFDLGDELEVTIIGSPSDADERAGQRAAVFAAGAGLTWANYGVADTGSLALLAAPDNERSVSLLPPIHIALLRAEDVVAEIGALFDEIQEQEPPSALTLITGPSRTGDIELTLTIGVHGPGELHVVLLTGQGIP